MKYALDISSIRADNIKQHLDIEKALQTKKDGLLTFTLRINGGKVVDFAITEYVDTSAYFRLKSITFEERTATFYPGQRDPGDTVRGNNG